MIFGRPPWNGKSQQELIENITKRGLTFDFEISKRTKDLLFSMLQISEFNRASWKEVFGFFEKSDPIS